MIKVRSVEGVQCDWETVPNEFGLVGRSCGMDIGGRSMQTRAGWPGLSNPTCGKVRAN